MGNLPHCFRRDFQPFVDVVGCHRRLKSEYPPNLLADFRVPISCHGFYLSVEHKMLTVKPSLDLLQLLDGGRVRLWLPLSQSPSL